LLLIVIAQGWFQSSMFCSLVATDHACSRAFLTHGFVVDQNGRKMSKSRENGISPQEIISQYNADVLRMWVSDVSWNHHQHSEKMTTRRL